MNNVNSEKNVVLGLDSSTTATKVIAWNSRGEILASARIPIPLSSPVPNYYEQDPGDWWNSACKALQHITGTIDPVSIKALAISNQRETFVPLDKDLRPLRPAILWLDERCKDTVDGFSKKIGNRKIHRITGKPVDYAPVVYRLAWMKKEEPQLFRNIYKICDVHTYLSWKLTALWATSWASAGPLGCFDVRKRQWSAPILAALGLTTGQFPRALPPGTLIGPFTGEACQAAGLLPHTMLVAGGGDGQAAGLGVNALSPERAYCNLGTALVAGIYGKTYKTDRAFRTLYSCSSHGYYYESSLRAGTFALDWFIRQILAIDPADNPEIYTQLEKEAESIPPGSGRLFFLPYLCGVMNPYWDIHARGAFTGLSASHTRGHMYRAILEGLTFELQLSLINIEKKTKTRVRKLLIIGGGAASSLWLRIIADITGREVLLPDTTEASCLGAGIAAAVGAGMYVSFQSAAERMTGTHTCIKPDMKNHLVYRDFFYIYKRLYSALQWSMK